jgi:hypothetical protein
LTNIGYKTTKTTYFRKAARNFYFIAIISFAVSLSLNQPDYFKNSRWVPVITDSISVLFIYTSLLFYLKKKIGLKLASAVYVYATFIDLAISTWFYYHQQVNFIGNFLFGTFMYCINMVVAGFCVGRRHAFIAAGLYIVSFGPLLFVSHYDYLYQNAITIVFLIIAFSAGVSGFLHVLENTHKEELALIEEIFEKDKALALEYNKKLSFDLEVKQKEVVTKTMFLLEYAENNNTLINKLNDLKKGMKNAEQKLLNDIIQNHQINHYEKYWKEFEVSFLEIHPDFYKKLFQVCPDVSPSELKLAALVRLGLSSKQIGSLISNAPESVDVARSRLRSKLNLPADTNLKTFLLSL